MSPAAPLSISPHISESEYRCHHCAALPPDFFPAQPAECFRELFTAFEKIRAVWGRPIPITSGYRCIVHNAEVSDGSSLGAHIYGLALDLQCASSSEVIDLKNLAHAAWPGLRIGWRDYLARGINIIHIDTAYLIFPRPTLNFIRGAQW
jgi:zinc D-Ala-D-Ala carboxypeptidase